MDIPPSFVNRLQRVGECLEFTGPKAKGYGDLTVNGVHWGAHRLAWTLAYGPIPTGLWVLHHCDNPPCCEPTHLFLGTNKDNSADRARKGRNPVRRGEANGNHRLTAEQVREIRLLAGQTPQTELARTYGVSLITVNRIVHRRRWASV